jgi:hypothetical protein
LSVSAAQAAAFYREVLRDREVWTVRDEGGYPAPLVADGVRSQPFWSRRSRAERIVAQVPAYSGMHVVGISYGDWVEKWLPGLHKDGVLVGLNWCGRRATGYDVAADDVLRSLAAREAT